MSDEQKLTGRVTIHVSDLYELTGVDRYGYAFHHETRDRAEAEHVASRVVHRGGKLELWRCVYNRSAASWDRTERLEIPS